MHVGCAPEIVSFNRSESMTTSEPVNGSSDTGARIVGSVFSTGPGPELMAASTLAGDQVISSAGEHIGKIAAITLHVRSGHVAYAVLSTGGFFGIDHSLHAIPWSALTLDAIDRCFVVDIPAQRLKREPGFDKRHCPSAADEKWSNAAHSGCLRKP
jgi:sporulation protein YlmC with PRC-barrel domain